MKVKALIVVSAIFAIACSGAIAEETAKEHSPESQQKISQEVAKEHILAAEQLEEAAGHHRKVAQFYKEGKFEDAGWNAYMAYAHELRAQEHINAAAMLHLSEKRDLKDKSIPAEPK